ncbi:MAG: PrgI family protein [Clostridiales bacterium]|nr:MAG: PrgI family protein [Clostridiales bacterium]
MEIKINKEIRDYQESIFMGLSLRQFLFSMLAVGVAVGIYFGLRSVLGTETVSWLCILGAFPFAILGFVKYHGMTAEQFIMAYIRSELLLPRQFVSRPVNLYAEAMKESTLKEVLKVD